VSAKTFRRYTNLAAVVHLLHAKAITLLNPATWDDRNDAYYMAEYKRFKQAKTVLALCFAETTETYHHWRVFSHGADGVCIEFDKDRLLKVWSGDQSVQTRAVAYKEIQQIRDQAAIALEDLPFIKRFPYRDEKEFRVIFVSEDEAVEHKDCPIQLTCIRRITLSPWMSKALAASVKKTLKSIPGCAMIKISRSTLVDNDAWKGFTARVVSRGLPGH
jgi:hypothetical protein